MDYFLNETNQITRLVKEWRDYGKIIIAFDYDDTVSDYHARGSTYNDVINLLKTCKEIGAYFIVFTSCNENQYDSIKDYLNKNDIPCNKINENMDFIKFTGRKIYYNILLDDRAGLPSAYNTLLKASEIMKQNK